MCIDDGCDELVCCICAPIAAIFCCKFCKDKMGSNNINQAPENSFYSDRNDRSFQVAYFGRPHPNQMRPFPGYSQQPFGGNYYPYHQDLPSIHIQQQPRPY